MGSEVKFTPGPWTVILRGERGTFHIVEAQKHEAARSDDGQDGYSVSSANRNLIAAAPDLFEALRKAIGMLEHVSVSMAWDEEETAQSQAIWDADVADLKAQLAKAQPTNPTAQGDEQ